MLERYTGRKANTFPKTLIRMLRAASSSDQYFRAVCTYHYIALFYFVVYLTHIQTGTIVGDKAYRSQQLKDYFAAHISLRDGRYYVRSSDLSLLKSLTHTANCSNIRKLDDPGSPVKVLYITVDLLMFVTLTYIQEEEEEEEEEEEGDGQKKKKETQYELEIGGTTVAEQVQYMTAVKNSLFQYAITQFSHSYLILFTHCFINTIGENWK